MCGHRPPGSQRAGTRERSETRSPWGSDSGSVAPRSRRSLSEQAPTSCTSRATRSTPLRPQLHGGTDIDILVRPAHVLLWTAPSADTGGRSTPPLRMVRPFGHAQTYAHPLWDYVDVHRLFPGIGLEPGAAFTRLWWDRPAWTSPARSARFPDVHRAGDRARAERGAGAVGRSLGSAAGLVRRHGQERAGIEAVVADLDARIAFDAAIGQLDRHRGKREDRLWRAVSQNGTRLDEWRACWRRPHPAPAGAYRPEGAPGERRAPQPRTGALPVPGRSCGSSSPGRCAG